MLAHSTSDVGVSKGGQALREFATSVDGMYDHRLLKQQLSKFKLNVNVTFCLNRPMIWLTTSTLPANCMGSMPSGVKKRRGVMSATQFGSTIYTRVLYTIISYDCGTFSKLIRILSVQCSSTAAVRYPVSVASSSQLYISWLVLYQPSE